MTLDELTLTPHPFPGLRPFHREEADIFFGRDEQIDQILKKLEDNRFVAVIGPSGCGKSSLVRAGVIPALEGGFLASAGMRWRVAIAKPGRMPLRHLANGLLECGLFESASADPEEEAAFLEATLGRGPLGLVDAMQNANLAKRENLLLLIDQFEELFRFDRLREPGEARAFVDVLLATAQHAEVPVYVLITMRSDFLGQCPIFAGLPEAINDSQFLTPRLFRDQAMAAIQGPLAMFDCEIDDAVVTRIVNELGRDPDRLPLMQHLLMQMWKQVSRDGGEALPRLTMRDYERAGTLEQALEKHVSRVFEGLNERRQAIAECLFRRLTEITPDGQIVRRPTHLSEICEASRATPTEIVAVIDAFRAEGRSFLVPPSSEPLTLDSTIDISHERLITQWPLLKSWTEDQSQSQETAAMVKRRAQKWEGAGERTDALLVGLQLEEALDWSRKHPADVDDLSSRFLDASVELREQEIRRQEALKYTEKLGWANRWLRYCALTIFGLFVFACALLVRVWLDAEVQEKTRRVNNAAERLKAGDLPGTLLWLDEAAATSSNWLPRDEINGLRRHVAFQQMPKLRQMFFAAPDQNNETREANNEARYADIAVSSDSSLLVALRRVPPSLSDDSFDYSLELMHLQDRSKESVPLQVSKSTIRGGDLEFVCGGDYLLVVDGDNLYSVQRGQLASALSGSRSELETVKVLASEPDWHVASIASDGQDHLATIEENSGGDRRKLRMWRVTDGPSGLALTEEDLPEEHFSEEMGNVQFARVSRQGHLLVIRRTSPDDASTAKLMQVWQKSDERWQVVPPVMWAVQAEQRWQSWGWKANEKEDSWEELDSNLLNACFNEQGNLVATATDDGEVRVWEIGDRTGGNGEQQLQVFPLLEKTIRLGASVYECSFIDDNRIVTAGRDRTARVWNLRYDTEVMPRSYHEGTVHFAEQFQAGSSRLLVTNTLRILRVWELQEKQEDLTTELNDRTTVRSEDWDILVSSDDDESASVANFRRHLNDLDDLKRASGERIRLAETPAFSKSGALLAIAGGDQAASGRADVPAVAVYERQGQSWNEVRVMLPEESPSSLRISRLDVAECEGRDILLAAGTQRLDDRERGVVFLGLLPEVDGSRASEVKLVPLHSEDGDFAHKERVLYATFDRTATWLVTTDRRDFAKVWEVKKLLSQLKNSSNGLNVSPRRALKHSSDVVFARFNDARTDGDQATFVTVSSEGEAAVWCTSSDDEDDPKFKVSHDGKVTFASFDKTGKWMVTAGQDCTARIWDADRGQLIGIVPHAGPVAWAGLTPDGTLRTISRAGDGQQRVMRSWSGLIPSRRDNANAAPATDDERLAILSAARQVKQGRLQKLSATELWKEYNPEKPRSPN